MRGFAARGARQVGVPRSVLPIHANKPLRSDSLATFDADVVLKSRGCIEAHVFFNLESCRKRSYCLTGLLGMS